MRKTKKQTESKESFSKKDAFPQRPKKQRGDRLKFEMCNFKKDKKKIGKCKSLDKVTRKKKPSCFPQEERSSLINPAPRRSLERVRNKATSEYQPKCDL